MTTIAIITVTAVTVAERMSIEDRSVPGVYGFAMGDGIGEHSDVPRNDPQEGQNPLEEAALDVFHDKIGIDCLDDFEVEVEILSKDDHGPDEVHWI